MARRHASVTGSATRWSWSWSASGSDRFGRDGWGTLRCVVDVSDELLLEAGLPISACGRGELKRKRGRPSAAREGRAASREGAPSRASSSPDDTPGQADAKGAADRRRALTGVVPSCAKLKRPDAGRGGCRAGAPACRRRVDVTFASSPLTDGPVDLPPAISPAPGTLPPSRPTQHHLPAAMSSAPILPLPLVVVVSEPAQPARGQLARLPSHDQLRAKVAPATSPSASPARPSPVTLSAVG